MKKIRRILTPIITALMWVAVFALTTLTINLVFGHDESVWTITLISTALMTLTTILWMPTGIELGEKVAKVHNNAVIYDNRANYIVYNQMFKKADEFCEQKNIKYEKELKVKRLTRFLITYEDFEKYEKLYLKSMAKNCTKKDKEEYEAFIDNFNDKQIKVMNKIIAKGINFAKLNTNDLIKFHDTKGRLKPKNTESATRNVRLIVKIVWGILLGIGTVGMIVSANQFGWEQGLQLILWTISIISNLFTSIWTSYRSVTINRNNYLIEKNDLCAEFFAYCDLKVGDIDNLIADKLWENDEKL